MARKIRKQVYLQKSRRALLKRLARECGVSQVDVIQQTSVQQAQSDGARPRLTGSQALEATIQFALGRRQLMASGEAYQWHRADAYEARD